MPQHFYDNAFKLVNKFGLNCKRDGLGKYIHCELLEGNPHGMSDQFPKEVQERRKN